MPSSPVNERNEPCQFVKSIEVDKQNDSPAMAHRLLPLEGELEINSLQRQHGPVVRTSDNVPKFEGFTWPGC